MKWLVISLVLLSSFMLGRLTVNLADQGVSAPEIPESLLTESVRPPRRAVDQEDGAVSLTISELALEMDAVSVRAVIEEKDPVKRAALFAALLDGLDKSTVKEAFVALQASHRGKRSATEDYEMALLLRVWGGLDGETAMTEASALLGEGGDKGAKIAKVGKRGEESLLGQAMEGWAGADLASAAAYVDALEDKRQQGQFRSHIVEALLGKSVDQAMAYIESLPTDDHQRARYVGAVAEAVLEDGLTDALSWMKTLPEDLQSGAMGQLASAYAQEDLDEAIRWASESSDMPGAHKAMAKVTGKWTHKDPRAVSEYLATLPASSGKDAAVEGFASKLASEDPQSAALWATTIDDERLRSRTMLRIASQWAQVDEAAAAAWASEHGLKAKALVDGNRTGKGKERVKRR